MARPGEVLVTCVALDQPADMIARLSALLSPEEQARAARFRGDELQRRFRVAHGALRVVVGAQLGLDPAALRLQHAQGVRPELLKPPPGRTPSFSLSHSGEIALVAVTDGARVGVDVEFLRPLDDAWRLAESVFTDAEVQMLRAVPARKQPEAWFESWTRKEAVLKAIGTGVRGGLRSLELLPPDFVPVARSAELARELSHGPWTVATFRPAPGCVAALTVNARAARWRLARWPGA